MSKELRDVAKELGRAAVDAARQELRKLCHKLLDEALDAVMGKRGQKRRRRPR
jgi:hypothetical protein